MFLIVRFLKWFLDAGTKIVQEFCNLFEYLGILEILGELGEGSNEGWELVSVFISMGLDLFKTSLDSLLVITSDLSEWSMSNFLNNIKSFINTSNWFSEIISSFNKSFMLSLSSRFFSLSGLFVITKLSLKL